MGAKIELIPDLSVAEAAEAVDRIEASVRRAVPIARVMYLEPDIFRTASPASRTTRPTSRPRRPRRADDRRRTGRQRP